MKAILISRTAGLLEELRRGVEAEGYEVAQALLRKSGQPLAALLADADSDLLIFDSAGAEPKDDLAALAALTGTHPSLAVIMLSASRDADALIAAMRAGIREVLRSPPSATELAAALRLVAQRKPAASTEARRGRVIVFIACKGGSGATFLATNLAYLLAAEYDKKTVLIDLDLQYGDASYYLTGVPGKANIADLARQIDRLDGKLLASSMLWITPNFGLIAAPEEPEAALGITVYQLERVLDVARENYDFVVLDLERMLDAVTIKALDQANLIFLVTENMIPFIRDAKRLVRVFRALGYPDSKLRLIVNRYQKGDQMIDLSRLETAVGLKAAGTIPNSFDEVSEAINTGVPLVKSHPNNPVVCGLRAIADTLAEKRGPGARGWISRMIGE